MKDDEILALWCAGRNTNEIAQQLGLPEALVANHLLEQRRARKAVNQ